MQSLIVGNFMNRAYQNQCSCEGWLRVAIVTSDPCRKAFRPDCTVDPTTKTVLNKFLACPWAERE